MSLSTSSPVNSGNDSSRLLNLSANSTSEGVKSDSRIGVKCSMGIFEMRFISADLGSKDAAHREGHLLPRWSVWEEGELLRIQSNPSQIRERLPMASDGGGGLRGYRRQWIPGLREVEYSASAWPLISSEPHSAIERGSKCTHVPMRNDGMRPGFGSRRLILQAREKVGSKR
jgi:hypothetical protein